MLRLSNISSTCFLTLIIFIFQTPLFAQTVSIQKDAVIASMVSEISAENIKQNIARLAGFGTRHSLSDTVSDERGIGAARRWVASELKKYEATSGGRLKVALDPFTVEADGRRIPQTVVMKNVMATLSGTDPNDDRIFIISGHLDSRASDVMDAKIDAPGANDDASGVAAIMELTRIMSRQQFPATIIFVAVSGEEQGLYGAQHLADKAKENNWNVVAMLNNDMISNSNSSETNIFDNTRVRVFSEGVPALETEDMEKMRRYIAAENDSKSRQLARYIKEIGERYVQQMEVVPVFRTDRFLRGGDHLPFSRNGFTAVRLCEMNENYYHQHQDVRMENGIQYGDLPEFIDADYAAKITGINLATLANLAMAPAAPENVVIDVRELTNTSTLRWDKSKNGSSNTYYVLLRETHEPLWKEKIKVEGTSVTLPYSKDNYFFGVQAVDEKGHESLAIFPTPLR